MFRCCAVLRLKRRQCVSQKAFLTGAGSSGRPRLIPPINCGSWRDDSLICSRRRSCCLGGGGEIGHAGTSAAGRWFAGTAAVRASLLEEEEQRANKNQSINDPEKGSGPVFVGGEPLVPPPSLLLVVSRGRGRDQSQPNTLYPLCSKTSAPSPSSPSS